MIRSVIKRGFDLIASLIAFIILIIPMIIIGVFIWLEDFHSPIFKQVRLTKDAKEFEIYKFRSMKVGTEESYQLMLEEDPRVTKIGHLIRRFRIDELPQLINIIKGDMSIVGPRPERPHIAKEIEKDLPEFADRLKVKAGLTGYAQVHGTYGTPSAEKLRMDMYYINHFSLILDLLIMLQTVAVIFDKESSKGIKVD